MNENNIKTRLLEVTRLAAEYCSLCETALEMEQSEFIDRMLGVLPRLYWEFLDITGDELVTLEEWDSQPDYVDEDYYDSIRRQIEGVMGPDDMFLETFEEDMKYSETPIAASIAESLADIFQPLFNYISVVKDTEGESMTEAFILCKEYFREYWSQTLCNVLRALNHIKMTGSDYSEEESAF